MDIGVIVRAHRPSRDGNVQEIASMAVVEEFSEEMVKVPTSNAAIDSFVVPQ